MQKNVYLIEEKQQQKHYTISTSRTTVKLKIKVL